MRNILFSVAIVVVGCACAMAEVADSAANGFTLKHTVQIKAAPEQVYRAILNVGQWWDPAHTYSQDAHNLSIEERAGGCWCEKLPGGGNVHHMQVVLLMSGKMLRFAGGLGPLQAMGVAGSMEFRLSPAEGGTKLEMTYAVGGYLPGGLDKPAPAVSDVLTEQMERLKRYVETGIPAARKQE